MKVNGNLYMYPEQGMMNCNIYLIPGDPGIIIDPGNPMYLPGLIGAMKQDGIAPEQVGMILNTHLHADHCGANESFKDFSGASIALHPVQKQHYHTVVIEAARMFGMPPEEFTEDEVLSGESIFSGELEIVPVTAPGHSPDSVCYYLKQERFLICGDVIFEANTGRTDLAGGSGTQLKDSIERLAELDIVGLFPGHMGPVAGQERVKANFEYVRKNIFPWI